MKMSFSTKQLEFDPPRLRVTLSTPSGGIIPIFLPSEFVDKTDSELFEMAIDEFYKVNYPLKAEKEMYETLNNLISKVESQLELNEKKLTDGLAELTELVMSTQSFEELLPNTEDSSDDTNTL